MLSNAGKIDAAAVVANFDDDLGALMIGVEVNRAASGFAGADAVFGRLDAVVDGIADEVH